MTSAWRHDPVLARRITGTNSVHSAKEPVNQQSAKPGALDGGRNTYGC
jgi:hypothetical protein